jgi:hypothetical protein
MASRPPSAPGYCAAKGSVCPKGAARNQTFWAGVAIGFCPKPSSTDSSFKEGAK